MDMQCIDYSFGYSLHYSLWNVWNQHISICNDIKTNREDAATNCQRILTKEMSHSVLYTNLVDDCIKFDTTDCSLAKLISHSALHKHV